MEQGTLDVVLSPLNVLFSREGLAPLEGVETRSDLMEALRLRAWEWRDLRASVCQCLSQGLPAAEVSDWMASVDTQLESERKLLRERLVQALVATGVPVIADSGVFHEVGSIVDPMDLFSQGDQVYGFTCQGMVFLDPSSVSLEAPLHEYAHLWATALRVANPAEWQQVVGLMRGTSVWRELSDRYQGALSDDRLAEEVVATYSGRKGTERLRTAGVSGWDRVVAALQSFWKGVCDCFGIHFDSAEEVADRVLRDFVSGVNPEGLLRDAAARDEFVALNVPARQLFMGEKGAAELDASTLFSARVECLQAANRMEADGRDPERIKLATGWERGVDGFWRYELPLAKIYDISFNQKLWKGGFTLDKLLDAPELFDAYPALRSLPVGTERMRNSAGVYRESEGILINVSTLKTLQEWESYGYRDKVLLRLRRLLLHEVQHWIQDKEGFAQGGSVEDLKSMLAEKKLSDLKEQDEVLFWFRHYTFPKRGKVNMIMGMSQATIADAIHHLIQRIPDEVEKVAQLKVVLDHIESLTAAEFSVFKLRAMEQHQTVQKIYRAMGKQAQAMYNGLAGEVEARNVEGRSFLSAAQRKGTLATETMDVPADEQLLRFSDELPTKVAARTVKR